MLKCRDVLALGSAYVDGTGSGGEKFALRAHLLVCGHCRRFIRSLRLTVRTAERLVLPVDEWRVREIVTLISPVE